MGQTNPDEHMLLDDNKYIADVLYEVKNSKQKDLQQSRLLFKKRMFRETDETITEAQFVNLSYVQVMPGDVFCKQAGTMAAPRLCQSVPLFQPSSCCNVADISDISEGRCTDFLAE